MWKDDDVELSAGARDAMNAADGVLELHDAGEPRRGQRADDVWAGAAGEERLQVVVERHEECRISNCEFRMTNSEFFIRNSKFEILHVPSSRAHETPRPPSPLPRHGHSRARLDARRGPAH